MFIICPAPPAKEEAKTHSRMPTQLGMSDEMYDDKVEFSVIPSNRDMCLSS